MTTTEQYADRNVQIKGARWLGADFAYVLRGGAVGLITLVLVVTGLAAGAGLAVVGIGVPVLVATLLAARLFATYERRWAGQVLGQRIPDPRYRSVMAEEGLVRRYVVVLSDKQFWNDAVHGLVRAVPGVAGFCVVVTWFTAALAGLTAPLWHLLAPDGVRMIGGLRPGVINVALGVVFA
jgi:hypothetical protein